MNDNKIRKINKFESKDRLREIDLTGSLKASGFSNNMTLADIGSGTGVLVFEASEYKYSKIYSLEMSDTMIEIQKDRIEERDIKNVEIINQNVDKNRIAIDDETCDIVSMITVFHEIDDKDTIIKEIKRILKPKGKLLIIEFNKVKTDFGPPLEERLSSDDIKDICSKEGLNIVENTVLGENFYRIIFEKL